MGCRYCITTHKTLPNTRVSTLFSVDLLSKDGQDLSIRKMFIASHTGMLCPVTFCVQDRAKQLLMMNYFFISKSSACPCAHYYFWLTLPKRYTYTNVGFTTLHLLHVLCVLVFSTNTAEIHYLMHTYTY